MSGWPSGKSGGQRIQWKNEQVNTLNLASGQSESSPRNSCEIFCLLLIFLSSLFLFFFQKCSGLLKTSIPELHLKIAVFLNKIL